MWSSVPMAATRGDGLSQVLCQRLVKLKNGEVRRIQKVPFTDGPS